MIEFKPPDKSDNVPTHIKNALNGVQTLPNEFENVCKRPNRRFRRPNGGLPIAGPSTCLAVLSPGVVS